MVDGAVILMSTVSWGADMAPYTPSLLVVCVQRTSAPQSHSGCERLSRRLVVIAASRGNDCAYSESAVLVRETGTRITRAWLSDRPDICVGVRAYA